MRDHTGKSLYRAVSIGMGDCEPLLIKYGRPLRRGNAHRQRSVEKLQNGDANDFYFWSQTSHMVDQSIGAANLDGKKLAVCLEKSAAAAIFDDLTLSNAWSSDHFRAIFEAISGAYADKAVARPRMRPRRARTSRLSFSPPIAA